MNRQSKRNLRPIKSLNLLSYREIEGLMSSESSVRNLFRECALAVLNTGDAEDDVNKLLSSHEDFSIEVERESRGPKINVYNAPASAFVDGRMIRGVQDHLFSVLRDIVYVNHTLSIDGIYDLNSRRGVTDVVFDILRNATIVRSDLKADLVVCWGGHSISRPEYDFTKDVGYQLGLRGLNIATGCGPGAMKGPMKGAAIGHSKQQIEKRRYVGITEPGIIAAEAPNPIVNELVILPDIEKRLEAFVRVAHSIVVFPGGAGTAEEVLYLLSILLHERNQHIPFSFIMVARKENEDYFAALDSFIRATLGEAATRFYKIVIGDAAEAGRMVRTDIDKIRKYRRKNDESYGFNWELYIESDLQNPFAPTHANMAALKLHKDLPPHELAGQIRKAFSGIVAGNVKATGLAAVRAHGPFKLQGDPEIMQQLETLLGQFIAQKRMKIDVENYEPCWVLANQTRETKG
ncbi:MAG: putative Rossmann-fold nucleotide-binding protein [Candidatus Pseudothioglobus sp.]|jgi:predicted Rossmann-fold nucleotide-binding protein